MPYPSSNSSSAFAKDEAYDYKNNTSKGSKYNEAKQPDDDIKDLHYGTEELLNALPKLWTRGVLYVLLGFAVLGLPWATLSKVDETGSARGRIEPKGATQKLDTPTGGSVKAVKVKEGDSVKSGQALMELDSDILRTELQQTEAKLSGLQNQRAQLDVIKNQLQLTINVQQQQNKSQELEKLAQINQVKQGIDAKKSASKLQALEKQALVGQARQNVENSKTNQKLVSNRLNRDSAEVERFRQLHKQGVVPQIKVVELEKAATESQMMHSQAESGIKQAQLRLQEEQNRYQAILNQGQADIEQAKLKLTEEENSYQTLVKAGQIALIRTEQQLKDLASQITAIESQIIQTQSQIKSLKIQLQQRIVRSPIDGVIFELPVSKAGAVVQPGQRIATVAPKDAGFVIKAQMPSEHTGFLKVGMPVKVKFDAYPFQEHGIAQGKVTWISPDSRINQTPQGNIETFELEITLEKQYIQNGGKRIPLTAGQSATAEVIIRQRRVIDFVLDPFKKLQEGGLEI
jgi:hemolysin D